MLRARLEPYTPLAALNAGQLSPSPACLSPSALHPASPPSQPAFLSPSQGFPETIQAGSQALHLLNLTCHLRRQADRSAVQRWPSVHPFENFELELGERWAPGRS